MAGVALAQGLPSSKATAAINGLVKCNMTTAVGSIGTLPSSCVDLFSGASVAPKNEWIPIMSKQMKLSNSQSLFVSPSLVSGLYTQTATKTRVGSTSTAQAMGAVYMRAVLEDAAGNTLAVGSPLNICDAVPATFGCSNDPAQGGPASSGVVLDSRIQTLSQTISACTILTDAGDGGACDFESTIEFILQTASANTFNFIFANVGQGTYTVKIYAAVGSGATIIEGSGAAVGAAAFGLGSVTIESVRLVNNFEF